MNKLGRGLLGFAAIAALIVGASTSVDVAAQDKVKEIIKDKAKEAIKDKAKEVIKDKVSAGDLTFEIYADNTGKFRWRLKAGDKNLAMSPSGYNTKAEAKANVEAIQKGAAAAKVIEPDVKK